MPVWQNHDGSERVVVSSREEIYEANKVYGQLTKVIFVRHGESEANLAKIHGNIDTKLSEKGKIQAKELSEKLKKENIEAIYCSHFTRALNTIEDFSKEINLQINIDERLGERNAGSFEGKLFDAYAQEEYSKATEDHDYQYGNGESFNDLKKR